MQKYNKSNQIYVPGLCSTLTVLNLKKKKEIDLFSSDISKLCEKESNMNSQINHITMNKLLNEIKDSGVSVFLWP